MSLFLTGYQNGKITIAMMAMIISNTFSEIYMLYGMLYRINKCIYFLCLLFLS